LISAKKNRADLSSISAEQSGPVFLPTLYIQGIKKDLQMQHAEFLQGIAGAQPPVPKRYKELKVRVQNIVDRYLSSEILDFVKFMRAFADFL